MKKQKTNKVKTVVYLIHFILIDIWARNGVLHIFSPTLLLCYVDDLLIASSTDKAFHRVFKELSKHVKVRETGRIALGKDGGGSLKFLGRVISRRAGSPSLVMQVGAIIYGRSL